MGRAVLWLGQLGMIFIGNIIFSFDLDFEKQVEKGQRDVRPLQISA